MSKPNGKSPPKGKHEKVRTFARIFHDVPWEIMSPAAKIAYVGICLRHDGENNGQIHYSYRDLKAQCRCSTETAKNAFAEIQKLNLVALCKKGKFVSHDGFNPATEWLICNYPKAAKRASGSTQTCVPLGAHRDA